MGRTPPSLPGQQRGALLILLVIALGILAVTLFVGMLTSSEIQIERDKKTAAALVEAKAALIGYAASDPNRPGELPCPDYNGDGQITIAGDYTGSKCKSYTGRLPWKNLGLPDLRDGYGEQLWYAVSVNFRANSTVPLNSDVPGQLSIGGISPANNVIAIVFAPGPPLSGQIRDAAHINDPASYLEGNNALGGSNTNFTTANVSSTFNDRLLPITNGNLFPVVEKRIANIIMGTGTGSTSTTGLREYYWNNSAYPSSPLNYSSLQYSNYPTTQTNTLNMLTNNGWDTLVVYSPTSPPAKAKLTLKYCNDISVSGQAGSVSCP